MIFSKFQKHIKIEDFKEVKFENTFNNQNL